MQKISERFLRFPRNLGIFLRCGTHNDGAGMVKQPFDGDEVLVPREPYLSKTFDKSNKPLPTFDAKLISHLEHLSLIRFDSEQAVANLRKAVETAKRIESVNTENIDPMHTVWEDQACPVFDDVEDAPLPIEKVFQNSSVSDDDYFVTPPGNVALESSERFDLKMINEWDKIGKPTAPEVKSTKLINDID